MAWFRGPMLLLLLLLLQPPLLLLLIPPRAPERAYRTHERPPGAVAYI